MTGGKSTPNAASGLWNAPPGRYATSIEIDVKITRNRRTAMLLPTVAKNPPADAVPVIVMPPSSLTLATNMRTRRNGEIVVSQPRFAHALLPPNAPCCARLLPYRDRIGLTIGSPGTLVTDNGPGFVASQPLKMTTPSGPSTTLPAVDLSANNWLNLTRSD